jgi:urease accessory protein UreF
MQKSVAIQPGEPVEMALLGEHHPLVQQLGSAEELHSLGQVSDLLQMPPVQDIETLRRFLKTYQSRVLMPLELPSIHQAYLHAASSRLRELIELDGRIASSNPSPELSNASRRVGQMELKRLRPLRDVRVLQRYLRAVETHQAQGWHTVVFGLTLAVYSVPLRQGLLGYAQQVIRGFIQMAGKRFPIGSADIEELMDELNAPLPVALGSLLLLEQFDR